MKSVPVGFDKKHHSMRNRKRRLMERAIKQFISFCFITKDQGLLIAGKRKI